MTTNRTPINRNPKRRITQVAIETFVAMERLTCTCGPPRWRPDGPGEFTVCGGVSGGLWVRDQCANCEEWGRLQAILHDEFGCRPWQWPCVAHPDEEGADPDAVALYRELKAAARANASARRRRAATVKRLLKEQVS
jgi:hypothetical protein